MRYFSTFTGIGGFEIGIQNAVESNRKAQQASANIGHSANDSGDTLQEWGQPATCVGYSEIDKYASSVYEYHFKGVKNYGDITKINAKELPDFECLVGGFPCQAFSIAGKRAGFADTRGTLFFDLARILRAKQPRLFVFENVKGLLSHDNGNTFRTIVATIDELGYDCQWQVLNSKNHGVPQNRERVIIVGHLRGTPRPEVFPITGDGGADTRLSGHISNTLTARYEGAQAVGTYIGESELNAQEAEIRRLTPLECERLQGFPDNWTANGLTTTNFVSYNKYGNIEICNKSKLKSGKNVQLKTVKDNDKQISAIALCTTKGGSDTARQIRSYDEITRGDHVSIAITKSENQELTDCVASITKCDDSTETHSIWSGKELSQGVGVILDSETANQSIELLLRSTLDVGWEQTRLSTTSTAIKQIIEWITSTLLTEQTTHVSIELLPIISDVDMTFQIYNLTEKHTESISDSARYKMCGNAVTTNVIQAVFERIFELPINNKTEGEHEV